MLEKVGLCNDCLRNAGILIVREIIKVCDVNIIGTCSGIICLCDFNDLGINLSKRYTAWEWNKIYFCSENKLLTN